jgi:hypothetical protein
MSTCAPESSEGTVPLFQVEDPGRRHLAGTQRPREGKSVCESPKVISYRLPHALAWLADSPSLIRARSRGKFRIRFAIDLQPVTSNHSLFRPFSCTISAAQQPLDSLARTGAETSSGSLGSWAVASDLATRIQLLAIPQRPISNPQFCRTTADPVTKRILRRDTHSAPARHVSPRVAFDFCSPPIPPT